MLQIFIVSGTMNADAVAGWEVLLKDDDVHIELVLAEHWRTYMSRFDPGASYLIDQMNIEEFPEALQLVQFLIGIGHGHTRMGLLVDEGRASELVRLESRGVCVHPSDESMEPLRDFLLGRTSLHHDVHHARQVSDDLRVLR